MMETSLAIVDSLATLNDIQQACFVAETHKLAYLTVHQNYINIAREILSGVKLSTFIDYPSGLSSLAARLHSIVEASRKGIAAIDLALNINDIVNERYESIIKDLKGVSNLAADRKLTVRPVVEYRLLEDSQLKLVSELCRGHGIDYLVLGTGSLAENFFDNLLTAIEVSEFGLTPVVNGALNQEHIAIAKENELNCIQFYSAKLASSLSGII